METLIWEEAIGSLNTKIVLVLPLNQKVLLFQD